MSRCLGDHDIERYCAGEMTDEESSRAADHLRTCPDCARRVRDFGMVEARVFDDLRAIGRTESGEFRPKPRMKTAAGKPPDDAPNAAADSPPGVTKTNEGASSQDSTPLPVGFNIPGYQFQRELHRGGQGIVFQAIQTATRRNVAIKVLLEGVLASSASKKRFDREVQLLSQLNHPNIVTVFDSGEASNGCRYCVMEHIAGRPISEHVRARDMNVREVLRLFAVVCRGVHYAHQRGVVHRDLKPSNILVETPHAGAVTGEDDLGIPRILDFGLGKHLSAPAETVVSLTGQVFGTLPYMSPEQVGGRPDDIDGRSDVYALGVILYELLTGRYPYPMDCQFGDAIQHIRMTEPTPPSRAWTADLGIKSKQMDRKRAHQRRQRLSACPIDGETQSIVLQCLSKDRRQRYQSAGELAEDIERYLAGEPIHARRRSTLYRVRKSLPRHKLKLALTALVVVTGIGTVAAVRMRERLREQRMRQRADLLDRMQQALLLMNADRLDDLTGDWKEAAFGEAEYETYRGWLHMLRLEDRPALEHADRAVALGPEDPIAHYLRACIRAYRYDWAGAAVDFSVAQKHAGDSFLELGLRGMLKGLLQQYDTSIQDLNLLVERHPGSAAALWVRGCSQWFHLLRDPPLDLDARWRLGGEARDDMSAAIKLYPTIPFVYDARADLYRRLYMIAKARGDERAAGDLLQLRRDDAREVMRLGAEGNALNILSTLAFDVGDFEEALRLADRAYERLAAADAPLAINRDDALRGMMMMRIWVTWALGEDAVARQLATTLAGKHPEWADTFIFGFIEAAVIEAASSNGGANTSSRPADLPDSGGPERSYRLGYWAGARFRGDEELSRRAAQRFSVSLMDRLRWQGTWVRFVKGDATVDALLHAAGEDVEQLQISRLTAALAAADDAERDEHLRQLLDLAHPNAVDYWARGIDTRLRQAPK